MFPLKNPKTTIVGILVAVAGVLSAATKDKMALHDWMQLVGMLLAAVAFVLAKDALSSDPPPPPVAVTVAPAPAPKVPPVVLGVLSAIGFVLAFVGCSALVSGCAPLTAQQKVEAKTAVEVAADLCKVGVLILAPGYEPFCATAEEYAKATIDLAKSQAGQVGAAPMSPTDELVALRERCIAIRAGK